MAICAAQSRAFATSVAQVSERRQRFKQTGPGPSARGLRRRPPATVVTAGTVPVTSSAAVTAPTGHHGHGNGHVAGHGIHGAIRPGDCAGDHLPQALPARCRSRPAQGSRPQVTAIMSTVTACMAPVQRSRRRRAASGGGVGHRLSPGRAGGTKNINDRYEPIPSYYYEPASYLSSCTLEIAIFLSVSLSNRQDMREPEARFAGQCL